MNDETKDSMTVTIALYKHVTHGWVTEFKYYGDDDAKFHTDNVRISEPLTVTFAPIKDDAVIQNALGMLDAMEKKARLELAGKLSKIHQQRANFMALTYQPEVA